MLRRVPAPVVRQTAEPEDDRAITGLVVASQPMGFESDVHIDGVRKLVEACQSPGFTFVNIGANDGVHNDPIYPFLEEYRWRGVAVEPDPDVFPVLVENYRRFPQVVLERAVIAPRPTSFYRIGPGPFAREPWMSQISAVSEARLREVVGLLRTHEWLGPVPTDIERYIEKIDVPCLTFADLVARHGIDRIDYLNIDVEGADLDILDMIDLDLFKNRLLCIEMDLAGNPRAADADARLRQLGYRPHTRLMLFSVFYFRE